MIEESQPSLLDAVELYCGEWHNMPEFSHEDLAPKYQLIINFSCATDVEEFGKLIGQPIKAKSGRQLRSLWYPEQEIGRMINKRYIGEQK